MKVIHQISSPGRMMELCAQIRFLLNQNTDLNVIYTNDSCPYEFNWYMFRLKMYQIIIIYKCKFASDLGKKIFNYFHAHISVWLTSSYNKLLFVFALCALQFVYFSVTSLAYLITQLFKEFHMCMYVLFLFQTYSFLCS